MTTCNKTNLRMLINVVGHNAQWFPVVTNNFNQWKDKRTERQHMPEIAYIRCKFSKILKDLKAQNFSQIDNIKTYNFLHYYSSWKIKI
jgi:hypothetical protein